MKIQAIIITGIVLLFMSPAPVAAGLLRPGTCGGCHVDSFKTWRLSAHSQSVSSEAFRASLSQYLLKEGTDDGRFCFRCHAPAILISGGWFRATKEVLKGRVPKEEGVTCIACHTVESVKDGSPVYDPGDSIGYHKVKDLRSINRESLCTTCHTYYKPEVAEGDAQGGLFKGIASGLRRIVSVKTVTKSDHRFSGAVVSADKDGSCPGMEPSMGGD